MAYQRERLRAGSAVGSRTPCRFGCWAEPRHRLEHTSKDLTTYKDANKGSRDLAYKGVSS